MGYANCNKMNKVKQSEGNREEGSGVTHRKQTHHSHRYKKKRENIRHTLLLIISCSYVYCIPVTNEEIESDTPAKRKKK